MKHGVLLSMEDVRVQTRREMIRTFRPVVEANDELQDYVSRYGEHLPNDLLKLISDMDWAVRSV